LGDRAALEAVCAAGQYAELDEMRKRLSTVAMVTDSSPPISPLP
jgi:hypothetical protein